LFNNSTLACDSSVAMCFKLPNLHNKKIQMLSHFVNKNICYNPSPDEDLQLGVVTSQLY